MDFLWSPWRYQYIVNADRPTACVFCKAATEPQRDAENLVVHRGERCFVILNRFPYTSGHLMVLPYAHLGRLEDLDEASLIEMTRLVQRAAGHLGTIYRPEGMNIGMNLGRCAGAGIADHIHTHVLPRWTGDANFLSVVGETRVLPEELATTWRKLTGAFHS